MGPLALIPVALEIAKYAAPQVARWLGGDKAGEAAEQIVGVAQAVTGGATPAEALERLRADRALQADAALKLAGLDADMERAYLADLADARARDREFIKAGRTNWRGNVLAFLAVGGLVACVWFIARDTQLPERAVNAIMFIAGQLANAVMMVYAFEFGSSRSSKDKESTIAKLIER